MNSKNSMITYFVALISAITLLSACGESPSNTNLEQDKHGDHAESETTDFERGSHNGRLLRDGDFAVEITIFEAGVAPEFRVYISDKNKPINPAAAHLSVELTRFAGVVDQHRFVAKDDYLVSSAEVYEPHSFDVTVIAEYEGRRYRWIYASYEGRTVINAEAAQASGIQIAVVGSGNIEERIALYGAVQPDATRLRSVVARFPGVIRSADVAVGEQVHAGQTLAKVESNESLQTYTVTAPIAGTVIQRNANPGDSTTAESLFEIADYSQMWAVLNIFPRDRARIQIGQTVAIRAADGAATSTGAISAISVAPVNFGNNNNSGNTHVGNGASSALSARVILDNRSGEWTPGQFVNADASVATIKVPLIVPITALQTFRDGDVVFLNTGEIYQVQPVQLGKRDGDNVEITAGLTAGMSVVVANSYLVKADIEKSGASHDH